MKAAPGHRVVESSSRHSSSRGEGVPSGRVGSPGLREPTLLLLPAAQAGFLYQGAEPGQCSGQGWRLQHRSNPHKSSTGVGQSLELSLQTLSSSCERAGL